MNFVLIFALSKLLSKYHYCVNAYLMSIEFFATQNVHTFRHVVTQTIGHWLVTAAAWFQSHVSSCGICGGQSGTGPGFLEVLQSPFSMLRHSGLVQWAMYGLITTVHGLTPH
jgi:hypothetical protein